MLKLIPFKFGSLPFTFMDYLLQTKSFVFFFEIYSVNEPKRYGKTSLISTYI